MRISGLILITAILYSSVLPAQLPDGWARLKDDTLVNARFRAHSQRLKSEKLASLANPYRSDYQKLYTTQFEEIDQFWQGNRAITDPDLVNYLNRIPAVFFILQQLQSEIEVTAKFLSLKTVFEHLRQ